MTSGLLVAAPRSGAGKTTVTLAILAALQRRGVAVAGAKSGPDYIDGAFHAAICQRPAFNLDSWAMPGALLDAVASRCAASVLVVEGAMGLFDGLEGPEGRRGAASDVAARWSLPVILVVDVFGQMQSAAAVARGFATHDRAVRVAGVVLNRVASARQEAPIRAAMAAADMQVFGALPRDGGIALPERHLGLVGAGEHADIAGLRTRLADLGERHLDLAAILDAAVPMVVAREAGVALKPPGQRVALARDAAFAFVYPHVLDGWRAGGAEIVPFSPLDDEPPADDCDCCWLPGGYPELHAGRLAAATRFRDGLRRFAATRKVHGECGGYMVLGAGLVDAEGTRHAMAGLLGHATSFAQRRLHLGYREATTRAASALGPAGTVLRGHEFHYACLTEPGNDAPLADLRDGAGRDLGHGGSVRGRVSGSFFHAVAEAE
ncbi:MAG: cobyrinate a,c-diamide synthase [Acetobacteraceae bacterium]|nr:cobyrinate a,c-diamide synthase [Acetobacteraceae bacterium]